MYVFFVQLDLDIDHIAPIAYKLAKTNPNKVLIVSTNILWDIKNDYRLRHLKDVLKIEVKYIHQIQRGLFPLIRMMRVLLCLPKWILLRVPDRVWSDFYSKVTGRIIDETWAASFLQSVKARAIVFDEGQPQGNLSVLSNAALSLGIPRVVVPTANNVLKSLRPKSPDYSKSDYTILPHRLTLPPDERDPRLKVLGCMRYCDEWEKLNSSLVREAFPGQDLPHEPGKLKVLVFGRHTKNFSENHSTVQRVCALDFITTIYKRKPRTTAPRKLYEVGYNNYPSSRLIQWADVVICSISSIVLDVLYYNKIFIYPKYIAPDETATFEDYNACWKVESEEELLAALETIHGNRNFRPYTADDVNSFYRDAVCNGDRANDILGAYADLIQPLCPSR